MLAGTGVADAAAMRREGKRRLGETPTAFGAHIAINLGALELIDAASAGELIDIGRDPQQHSPDATDVNDDVAALGMICFGAQVDHRRVLADLKLGQPGCAVAQPLDLIAQPLCDQLAPGQLVIATAVGSSAAGQPYSSERSELSDNRVIKPKKDFGSRRRVGPISTESPDLSKHY
jgi:hypothetical protein